jgi:hypothetical protein
MLSTREFAVGIDVEEPISICIGDYKKSVKRLLDEKYLNVVFDEFLIRSTEIIDLSQPVYNRGVTGSAQISVYFYAKGIYITENDVIVDTVIKDNTTQNILVHNSYIVGMMQLSPLIKGFKIGDLLPVTVSRVTAIPFKPNINISCIPYYFTKKSISIRESNLVDKNTFNEILNKIQENKAKINKYDKQKIDQLSRLIQYGMNPEDGNIPQHKTITSECISLSTNSDELLKQQKVIENNIISIHIVDKELDFVILKSDVKQDAKIPVLNSEAGLHEMLSIYNKFLQILDGLLEIFSKQSMDLSKCDKLWYLYYNIASKTTKK